MTGDRRLALSTLVVADYDEAIGFFVGKLGFSLVEDKALGSGKRWVVVRPGDSGAGLLLAKAVGTAQQAAIGSQAGGRVAFFLETDDFARDHARMIADGVQFLEPPRDEAYGMVTVFVDCSGNRWDLIERR